MKSPFFLSILTVLALGSSHFSIADSINEKQINQQIRINNGIKNGELSRREVINLNRQQVRIEKKEQRFKSDGNFTRKERVNIRRDLNKSSHNIYRQKHDKQKRR